MSSGGFALQTAIVTALSASNALKALIGDPVRLYQDVQMGTQRTPQFPYVVIGDTDDHPDLAEYIDGWEIFVPLNIYSRAGGFQESKAIGSAIDDVLHNASISLAGNWVCKTIERGEPNRYVLGPDNTTKHGLVTFRAVIEPTD